MDPINEFSSEYSCSFVTWFFVELTSPVCADASNHELRVCGHVCWRGLKDPKGTQWPISSLDFDTFLIAREPATSSIHSWYVSSTLALRAPRFNPDHNHAGIQGSLPRAGSKLDPDIWA